MRRTLVLKKETLTELTPYQLRAVAGGAATTDCVEPPSNVCIHTHDPRCLISRVMYHCPTEPTLLCD